MTHTVCGQPVTWRELPMPWHAGLREQICYCEKCGRVITDNNELSPGRPWELVEDNADLPKA